MGLDWRTLTWPHYQMLLAGWNAQHGEDGGKGEVDYTRLKRAMAAHASLQ